MQALCLTADAYDLFRRAQDLGFQWGVIYSPEEALEDPHFRERGMQVPVEHPELGREFTYPGPAAIYNASPWSISRRAPLIGEHNDEVLGIELGLSKDELEALKKSGAI